MRKIISSNRHVIIALNGIDKDSLAKYVDHLAKELSIPAGSIQHSWSTFAGKQPKITGTIKYDNVCLSIEVHYGTVDEQLLDAVEALGRSDSGFKEMKDYANTVTIDCEVTEKVVSQDPFSAIRHLYLTARAFVNNKPKNLKAVFFPQSLLGWKGKNAVQALAQDFESESALEYTTTYGTIETAGNRWFRSYGMEYYHSKNLLCCVKDVTEECEKADALIMSMIHYLIFDRPKLKIGETIDIEETTWQIASAKSVMSAAGVEDSSHDRFLYFKMK